MSPNFIPTELLLSDSLWMSSEDLTEHLIEPSVKAVLQFNGLLTSALGEAYAMPVSVTCLRQLEWAEWAEWAGEQGTLGLRRDVLLKAGDVPVVAASTLMPSSVLAVYPWLANLGDKPLGEALKSHGHFWREPFEFMRIDAGLIFQPPPPATTYLWARRFRFTFDSGALLVTEIFFPGVLDRLSLK
ncbi:MAG TPA: chorismate lyase [Blastocatellia bacterium]|nr:chorismate lyase [Blastocatellia bacterium]